MAKTTYITPSLGRKAMAILGVWLLVNIAIASILRTPDGELEIGLRFSINVWLVGVTYGFASGVCWIATIARNTFSRFGIRLFVVAASACLMTLFTDDSWFFYVSNLCGLLIFQTILVFLLRIPDWEFLAIDPEMDATGQQHHQFQIADVIIATTSIALLLAIGMRYATPIDSLDYWLVVGLIWLVGPMIAASLFAATMSQRTEKGMGMGILAAMLAATTAGALSYAETLADENSLAWYYSLLFYACILLGYFVTLLVVGIAGRAERRATATIDLATGRLDSE
jgi:hypothetical protein